MISLFSFLNDQLLRMDWLSALFSVLLFDFGGLDPVSPLGGALHFFLYDAVKIFILLAALIFGISYVQSYFPPERTRRLLSGVKGLPAHVLGALFGTITPFCSCSSIPLFIGFTGSGLPVGVTFSFLISSPLVDLASVILLAGIFGWKVALFYVAAGIVLAVAGGTAISAARMEGYIEPFVFNPAFRAASDEGAGKGLPAAERCRFARDQVHQIVTKVWPYVLVGVAIGAAIHNWIPQAFIVGVLGTDKPWSVPLAVAAGVPMYADIFGTLPVAEALLAKGVGLGTVLAFMMAVTTLSLPSLVMLRKVVKPRLLALFFVLVVGGILLIGTLFNYLF